MTNFLISGLYAAALAALFLVLTLRVITYRRDHGISLGTAQDPVPERRIRAQGNFSETVPMGLILLILAEVQGVPPHWLHAVGGMLLLGRLMHGLNFSFNLRLATLRVGGMMLTVLSIAMGAVLMLSVF